MKPVPSNTRKWFDKLPDQYREAFYDILASMPTHELWEWIIDILPLRDAEDLMVNLTKDWEDEEIGTPYKRSMKR